MTDLPTIEEFAEIAPKLLFDPEGMDKFVATLRAASDTSSFSVGTEEGRKQIRSAARRVASFKNVVDTARKNETEGLRKKTKEINDAGNAAVEKLETLQDEIKRPVDQWEEQDRARIEEIQTKVGVIASLSVVAAAATSAALEEQLKKLQAIVIDASYAEQAEVAHRQKETGERDLSAAIDDRRKREFEQAELAELRRQKAEREAADAEAERQRQAAAYEAARKADEERRIEAAKLAAAEQARAEAERKATEEAARIQREADERVRAAERAAAEKIAAERREREEKEHAERLQREQAEAKAAAEREAEEKRKSSARRREKILREAGGAIARIHSLTDQAGYSIAEAIADGRIPHLKVEW